MAFLLTNKTSDTKGKSEKELDPTYIIDPMESMDVHGRQVARSGLG